MTEAGTGTGTGALAEMTREEIEARHTARLGDDAAWTGYLTLANYTEVAARLERMLRRQFFTVVTLHSAEHIPEEVLVSQYLREAVQAEARDGRHGEYGEIRLRTGRGGYYLGTRVATGFDACAIAGSWEEGDKQAGPGTLTRLRFSHRRLRAEVTTRDGDTKVTVVAVEDHYPELPGIADCAALAATLAVHADMLAQTVQVVPDWLAACPQHAEVIAAAARQVRASLDALTAAEGMPADGSGDTFRMTAWKAGMACRVVEYDPVTWTPAGQPEQVTVRQVTGDHVEVLTRRRGLLRFGTASGWAIWGGELRWRLLPGTGEETGAAGNSEDEDGNGS